MSCFTQAPPQSLPSATEDAKEKEIARLKLENENLKREAILLKERLWDTWGR